ncbi:MAG TPA: ATP-binding protein [Streptosporangiaceae bacterium]|nr:ATP-binding protein [Streptosporangiaceae bacterium]
MTRLPLRLRVTLASAASLGLILGALSSFVYVRLHTDLALAADADLRAQAELIASQIGNVGLGGLDVPDQPTGSMTQVLAPDGRLLLSSGSRAPGLSAAQVRALRQPRFLDLPAVRGRPAMRAFAQPVAEPGRLYVVVGSTQIGVTRTLAELRLVLETAAPAAFALACMAAWVLVGAALRPVERMHREAAEISVSEPGRRLPVPATDDEVARLGRTLNSLLDRLQAALEREQRLLDDASHELRTPLSILKAELDLTLSRDRSLAELECALHSASEETDHLVRLAEDLLVLSRVRTGGFAIHRTPQSLRTLLTGACRAHQARAQERGTKIEWSAPEAEVRVDAMRLRQALDNLLDNAIRYGPDRGGLIRVDGVLHGGVATLSVENSGPGFAGGLLPGAFEAFTRGSEAGTPRPGAGLGLAIVRAVAEAHGGTAVAANVPGGARLTVTLALGTAPGQAPA